ncbi:TIR domain-containing protein, partial [Frankia casuarinae]
MKNYFFISYAADEDRRWVQRFHADLEYELRVQVGSAVGGILDTRPRPGMDADLALAAGAGGTRVMVALCSDPFFRDAWCGREWEVFHSRIENFSKAGATRLEDGFLRVLWRPTQDPVPAVATRDLADASAGLPDTYRQRGLLWMMRKMLLGAGGYYWFVRMLAARIVAAQQITLDPVPDLAVRRAAAAFGSHPGSSGDPSEAMPPFLPLAGSVNGNGNVNGNGRAGFRTHGDGDEARRAASIGTAPPVPTPTTTSRRTTPPVASDVPSPQTPLAEVSRLVAISYVGADQEWADWLEYLLRRG